MKRTEAVVLALLAILMMIAGLTWKFGAWGLIGGGAGMLVAVMAFVDVKGDADDD